MKSISGSTPWSSPIDPAGAAHTRSPPLSPYHMYGFGDGSLRLHPPQHGSMLVSFEVVELAPSALRDVGVGSASGWRLWHFAAGMGDIGLMPAVLRCAGAIAVLSMRVHAPGGVSLEDDHRAAGCADVGLPG